MDDAVRQLAEGAGLPEPVPRGELADLAHFTRQAARYGDIAAEWRRQQHAEIIRLARAGWPYGDIAAVTGISPQAVGKLARAAGIRRYRQGSR
jgi:hypothetical protein